MIHGTDKIQSLVNQAASLNVTNALYLVGLLTIWVFALSFYMSTQTAHTLDLLILGGCLIALSFVCKTIRGFMPLDCLHRYETQFDVLFSSINCIAALVTCLAIKLMPGSSHAVTMLSNFVPALLVMCSLIPLKKCSGKDLQGVVAFFAFGVFFLSTGSTIYLMINAFETGAYFMILSNTLLLSSPLFINFVREKYVLILSKKMEHEIYIDPLTGIKNRKCFYDDYDVMREKTKHESSHGFGLFFVDIDFFKQFNDVYGHAEGDICLQKVAQHLECLAIELGMKAYRFGGEEFILCGSFTPELWSKTKGGRLITLWKRQEFKLDIPHSQSSCGYVTMSAGACYYDKETIYTNNAASITKIADKYLYKAKSDGRGKIIFSD